MNTKKFIFITWFAVASNSWILITCRTDPQLVEFRKGEKYIKEEKVIEALSYYERAMSIKESPLSLEAARKASQLSYFHLKNFRKTLDFYRYLVLHSDSEKERISFQEKIVNVYFDKLADYKSALSEIHRLLEMPHTAEKKMEYGLKTAKSYFYLGDFKQALVEVENLLSGKLSHPHKFATMSLKGDIYLTAKKLQKAIGVYRKLQRDFPQQVNREKIGLNIAFCYEELDELDLAIEELKKVQEMTPKPELIAMKIKRLGDRKKNLPMSKAQ